MMMVNPEKQEHGVETYGSGDYKIKSFMQKRGNIISWADDTPKLLMLSGIGIVIIK